MPTSASSSPRRSRSRQQGRELITAFRTSGISVKAFAAQHGIPVQSIYYWLKQCEDLSANALIPAERATSDCQRGFIEIRPDETEVALPSSVVIQLPNRIAIHLPSSSSPHHVAAVVSALSRQSSPC